MEPEGSLPLSQEPATCPYHETYQFSLYPLFYLLKIHFNFILPPSASSVFSMKGDGAMFYISCLIFVTFVLFEGILKDMRPKSI